VRTGGNVTRGSTLYLDYNGARYSMDLIRNGFGQYVFKDALGDWSTASYNSRTCG
jgi:hypothetical protein